MGRSRHVSRKKLPYRPLDLDRLGGMPRVETDGQGRESTVRRVRGSDKTYRCPGCDQLIAAGTPHVVAWSNDHLMGAQAALDDRRHWHTACWEARGRRAPQRRR